MKGWKRRRDLESMRRRRALEERGGIQREEKSSFGKELLEVGLECAAVGAYGLLTILEICSVAIIVIFAITWVVCSAIRVMG
jgi:hypothetical protein